MLLEFCKKYSSHKRTPFVFVLIAGVVGLFSLLPLIYLGVRSFELQGQVLEFLLRPKTIEVIFNTVFLALSVTLTAILISLPLAFILTKTDLPFKKSLTILLCLPLSIPSLIGAYGYLGAFGHGGIIHSLLLSFGINIGEFIYGGTGSWIVLTLINYPYVLLTLLAAFNSLDENTHNLARSMGRGEFNIFLMVTLPQLSPAIWAGALLVSLYTLSDFSAVTLLQFDSFTRAIYVQYEAVFNRQYAAFLSLLLVVLAMVILFIQGRYKTQGKLYLTRKNTRQKHNLVRLGRNKFFVFVFIINLLVWALGVPLIVIFYWLSNAFINNLEMGLDYNVIFNSLYVSGIASLISVLVSLPVAYLIVRYHGIFSSLIQKTTYISYSLPGIVVALSFVFWAVRFSGPLYQTVIILILAYVILFLPLALGTIQSNLSLLSPNIEELAASLGKSYLQVWIDVLIPILWPALRASAALVFLTAMKELPTALLLGPPGFSTLTTTIWGHVSEAYYAQAAFSALILVSISGFSLIFILKKAKNE